jgi:hypothetical protein
LFVVVRPTTKQKQQQSFSSQKEKVKHRKKSEIGDDTPSSDKHQ